MEQATIIGLDLAKRVFQVHGATADGRVAFRKKLSRGQVSAFLAGLPPCVVAMEACATAHYWAREIGALGHDIRLVPPAYVKPFVKRQKSDAADAEAIAEAASRPTMRFVEPKSPRHRHGPWSFEPAIFLSARGHRQVRLKFQVQHPEPEGRRMLRWTDEANISVARNVA